VAGWRLLTDPTFDPPGRRYSFGWGSSSRKLTGPAVAAADLGPIDAVLLSHDHHGDNLDSAGRALVAHARGAGALMGSVTWRTRGHRYQVSWRLDDGSQGAKTVDSADEARDLAAEKRLELRRGTWQGRRRGRLPFSRWADEWWELYSTDPGIPRPMSQVRSLNAKRTGSRGHLSMR
jgi:hypothetical protein